jgi:hypothetical protein
MRIHVMFILCSIDLFRSEQCSRMESAWEQLRVDLESSKSKLIGEIDCTLEMSLCEAEGIEDFPALRWGSIYDLQEYGGPRDYVNLKKFADSHLKPICGPNHMQVCDKATRKEIRRLQKLSMKYWKRWKNTMPLNTISRQPPKISKLNMTRQLKGKMLLGKKFWIQGWL